MIFMLGNILCKGPFLGLSPWTVVTGEYLIFVVKKKFPDLYIKHFHPDWGRAVFLNFSAIRSDPVGLVEDPEMCN